MANSASPREPDARPTRAGATAGRARPTGRDEVYDAVLDAAQRLFAASGPTGVSLREIAREAGVTYGLVHRHFGTKEQLIERLLQRYAERWQAQLASLGGYDDVLEFLLGPGPEPGAYLRLLAWTLLNGDGDVSADAHRRHALLDQLPAMRAGEGDATRDATLKTAASLAFVFGWRFFNPFIRAALHLDGDDPAEIHDAMRAELKAMLASPTAAAPTAARHRTSRTQSSDAPESA